MRQSRFKEEQIIGILREHEAGVKTADLCRKHGISIATFFQVEGQVRGPGRVRGPSAEVADRRERQAEEAAGGRDAR